MWFGEGRFFCSGAKVLSTECRRNYFTIFEVADFLILESLEHYIVAKH